MSFNWEAILMQSLNFSWLKTLFDFQIDFANLAHMDEEDGEREGSDGGK